MLRYFWIALLVFAADQITKLWALKTFIHGSIEVTAFFNLVLAFNTGAAFGFLDGAGGWQNLMFIAIATTVSVVILLMIRRLERKDLQTAVGLFMILGGAVGNLLDRVRLGYVIDFIQLHYQDWYWPVFNIADSAITVGAALLILDTLGLGLRTLGARS